MTDANGGSSLFQTSPETVHREHHHPHNHLELHRRQTAVTEVTATISVVQQVDVDGNGSVYATETVLESPPASSVQDLTTDSATATPQDRSNPASTLSTATPSETASISDLSSTSELSSESAEPSLLSSLTTLSVTASVPSISSSGFPSLVTSNSTVSISSTSSISTSTNTTDVSSSTSTIPSSCLSSSCTPTLLLTSYASDFSGSLATSSSTADLSSVSSFLSPSSQSSTTFLTSTPISSSFYSGYPVSSPTPTSSGAYGDGVGGSTVAGSAAASSSTAAAGDGGSGDSSTPPTSTLVGGVIGGVAGAAVVAVLLLMFVKWYKRKHSGVNLLTSRPPATSESARDGPEPARQSAGSGEMAERASNRVSRFVFPEALAGLVGKRGSRRTVDTVSSTAGSEHGFYKVSGRKLPPVLQYGGDGYGGGVEGVEPPPSGPNHGHSLSGQSFYRDSQGFHGGAGVGVSSPLSPTGLSPPGPSNSTRLSVPVMRPSPARTPTTSHTPFSASEDQPENEPPRRPDALGRSRPSHDGSHTSRFSEAV